MHRLQNMQTQTSREKQTVKNGNIIYAHSTNGAEQVTYHKLNAYNNSTTINN